MDNFVDLDTLDSIVVGSNSFPNATTLSLIDLPTVNRIEFKQGSFGKLKEIIIKSIIAIDFGITYRYWIWKWTASYNWRKDNN